MSALVVLNELDGQDGCGYEYYWFRHHDDGSTFIACKEDSTGCWYMCGLDHPIISPELSATLLGRVPRTVVGGGSIDQ